MKLWNLSRRRAVVDFCPHAVGAGIVRVDADTAASSASADQRVFTQGRDGLIKCWRMDRLVSEKQQQQQQQQPETQLSTGAAHFCQFALPRWSTAGATSHLLVAACAEQGSLQLWDLRCSATAVSSISSAKAERGMVMCCRLLTPSEHVPACTVVAGYEDGSLEVHDLRASAAVATGERMHSDPVMACDVARDGRAGVCASAGSTLATWALRDAATSAICTTAASFEVSKSTPGVGCAELRPDCELFAAGCWDASVRLYRWRQPVPLAVLPFHEGSVNSVAFSPVPGSGVMAAGSKDGRISIWDMYGTAAT